MYQLGPFSRMVGGVWAYLRAMLEGEGELLRAGLSFHTYRYISNVPVRRPLLAFEWRGG